MEALTKQRGWLHLILGWSIVTVMMYWGSTQYAMHTKLIPSKAIAELMDFWNNPNPWYLILMPVFFFVLFPSAIGFLIEWVQAKFFDADFQKSDAILTGVGGVLAMPTRAFTGQSNISFIIGLIGLAGCVLYTGYLIWHKNKKN